MSIMMTKYHDDRKKYIPVQQKLIRSMSEHSEQNLSVDNGTNFIEDQHSRKNISSPKNNTQGPWKSEKLIQFCKQRTRAPTPYDKTRFSAQVEAVRQRITSTWKPFEQNCTPEFANMQESHFRNRMLKGSIPLEGPIGCQDCEDLLDLFHLLSPSPDKVFVEIGAN